VIVDKLQYISGILAFSSRINIILVMVEFG